MATRKGEGVKALLRTDDGKACGHRTPSWNKVVLGVVLECFWFARPVEACCEDARAAALD